MSRIQKKIKKYIFNQCPYTVIRIMSIYTINRNFDLLEFKIFRLLVNKFGSFWGHLKQLQSVLYQIHNFRLSPRVLHTDEILLPAFHYKHVLITFKLVNLIDFGQSDWPEQVFRVFRSVYHCYKWQNSLQ